MANGHSAIGNKKSTLPTKRGAIRRWGRLFSRFSSTSWSAESGFITRGPTEPRRAAARPVQGGNRRWCGSGRRREPATARTGTPRSRPVPSPPTSAPTQYAARVWRRPAEACRANLSFTPYRRIEGPAITRAGSTSEVPAAKMQTPGSKRQRSPKRQLSISNRNQRQRPELWCSGFGVLPELEVWILELPRPLGQRRHCQSW
jgi:hypothetical protein